MHIIKNNINYQVTNVIIYFSCKRLSHKKYDDHNALQHLARYEISSYSIIHLFFILYNLILIPFSSFSIPVFLSIVFILLL